jgi:hypothetical protein
MVIPERMIATKLPVVTEAALTVDWKQIPRRRQQFTIAFVEQVNVFGRLRENLERHAVLPERLDLSTNERLTENGEVPDVVRNSWIRTPSRSAL